MTLTPCCDCLPASSPAVHFPYGNTLTPNPRPLALHAYMLHQSSCPSP